MKKIFIGIILCISSLAQAQEIIRGIVVDSASFAPLPYVSILVKNQGRGTSSDAKGNFSILATRKDTLIFTLVGYERVEYPLFDWEPSMIRMAERRTLLKTITINDTRLDENPFEGLFDEQNAKLKKSIPFYYSRARKDKIKAGRWREENVRVKTYVDVVINNPDTKDGFMKKYSLSEDEYYAILTRFNEKYYNVMYYLTASELISQLNRFFESNSKIK
jgi:hypothetical protein